MLVKRTTSTARVLAPAEPKNVGKEVVVKNCAQFTDCISEKNNTQVDNVKTIGVLMPMYDLRECGDTYSKHQEVYRNTIETKQL